MKSSLMMRVKDGKRNRRPVAESAPAWVALALAAVVVVGCAGGDQESETTPLLVAETAADSGSVQAETRIVPAGTMLAVEFLDGVSSETSTAGDRFRARVVDDVSVDGRVAIAAGDEVVGSVLEAVPSKKIGGKATLRLAFESLETSTGDSIPVSATFVEEGRKQAGKDAATIGGATAGGALLGRIIGHQKDEDARGTTIGAVVGAAVGTAIAATNEGDPVSIASGTVVGIRLDGPAEVPVS
jgi:hypothetical protein